MWEKIRILLAFGLSMTLSCLAQAQAQEKSSEWKTYRSEKLNFEFQYPATWKIDESEEISAVSFSTATGGWWEKGQPPSPHPWLMIFKVPKNECHKWRLGIPIFLRQGGGGPLYDETSICYEGFDILAGYWAGDPNRFLHRAQLERMLADIRPLSSK